MVFSGAFFVYTNKLHQNNLFYLLDKIALVRKFLLRLHVHVERMKKND